MDLFPFPAQRDHVCFGDAKSITRPASDQITGVSRAPWWRSTTSNGVRPEGCCDERPVRSPLILSAAKRFEYVSVGPSETLSPMEPSVWDY